MKSESDSPKPASHLFSPIALKIRGCGNLVSFKNSKMILPARAGRRAMLITEPRKQKAMESYIRAIESELRSAYQTAAREMQTECSLQSWIASSMPQDDSWKWVPEINVRVEFVPAGEEGADITIEKL